jgi:hypothetical protein
MKHKHYDLIMAWAEGSKIETLDSETGKWKQTEPLWFDSEEYRVYDPYLVFKEALKDPNKEIALVKYSDGAPIEKPTWKSGTYWNFTNPPDYYAIRDKPTKIVSMWQWICLSHNEKLFTSSSFYANRKQAETNTTSKVIGPAKWTEIEVEVDMEGNIV